MYLIVIFLVDFFFMNFEFLGERFNMILYLTFKNSKKAKTIYKLLCFILTKNTSN